MAVSDEQMLATLAQLRDYTIVVLKPTPARQEPGADAIVREHGRRNMELREDGVLSIVCLVPGGQELSGISIFNASPERVRAIMDGDPGVAAGIFTYEMHSARSFPGDALPA